MLNRLIYRQLPPWAHPTHPMMRHAIGYVAPTRRQVIFRAVVGVLLAAGLITLGLIYNLNSQEAQPSNYREWMYYPLVAMQLLTQIFAIVLTVNAVAIERQKGTWESLQVTAIGAVDLIRTHWMLVFYRLRGLLLLIFVLRLGYAAFLIHDVTDFQGRAIDVRIIDLSAEIDLNVAVILLAALMTAFVLLPFVMLAFDGAVGLFLGSLVQRRSFGLLSVVVLLMSRLAVSIASLYVGAQVIGFDSTTTTIYQEDSTAAWARILLLATQGDYGLRLMNLDTLGSLWIDVSEGVYLGGILLGLVVLIAVLSNLLVLAAGRRAARPGKF
jgi:hypothetical protein